MGEEKCWICGNIADSGEHRIKNSDLKLLFGSNIGKKGLLLFKENKVITLQSTNSKFIKSKILCKSCNGNKTQPFDKAYEIFIKYIDINVKEIVHKRFIDFGKVYGDNFEEKQRNLYKYLVKNFGTQLAHHNHPIPQDMIDLLDKKHFQTGLSISFAINEVALNAYREKGIRSSVGNGSIMVNQSYVDGTSSALCYTYNIRYDWLEIYYYYNCEVNGSLGSTWIANNRFIYLGSSTNDNDIKLIRQYKLKKIKWFTLEQLKEIQKDDKSV